MDINVHCNLTIVIPWLCWLLSMAKVNSSMVVLAISETSDSVTSFNFEMCTFACQCFPMELVPCSDGWWITSWQKIYIIPGLLVSIILQCKYNCHKGTCLESFQAICCMGTTLIDAQQVSHMICKVLLLKSWSKTRSFIDDIITTGNEVLKDVQSDRVWRMWNSHNSICETVKRYLIIQ